MSLKRNQIRYWRFIADFVLWLGAPAAIGPYSQAIKAGDLLFCSGCIPLDATTGEIVTGGVEAQTEKALANLKAVVEAGGSELGKVVKTTVRDSDVVWDKDITDRVNYNSQVFLKSMNDFVAVNGIYAKFFGDHKPARSAVEVARLPKDVLVEVEAIVRYGKASMDLSARFWSSLYLSLK